MIKSLAKPRRQRTDTDMVRVKSFIKNSEFFQSLDIDDKTMNSIVATAGFSFTPRGQWVFRQGDYGDILYIVLHGHCKTVIQNKGFLEERRALRERILQLYSMVENGIELEQVLAKKAEEDDDFAAVLEEYVINQ